MLIIEFDNDNAKNEKYGISNPIFEASKNYPMRFILLYTFLIDIALKFVTEQINYTGTNEMMLIHPCVR